MMFHFYQSWGNISSFSCSLAVCYSSKRPCKWKATKASKWKITQQAIPTSNFYCTIMFIIFHYLLLLYSKDFLDSMVRNNSCQHVIFTCHKYFIFTSAVKLFWKWPRKYCFRYLDSDFYYYSITYPHFRAIDLLPVTFSVKWPWGRYLLHSSRFSAFRRLSEAWLQARLPLFSSHLFLCLPLGLPSCIVSCRTVLVSPDVRVTCPSLIDVSLQGYSPLLYFSFHLWWQIWRMRSVCHHSFNTLCFSFLSFQIMCNVFIEGVCVFDCLVFHKTPKRALGYCWQSSF